MKSIKEKSDEYSSGYMNLDRQQVAKQAFEAGANYVLECFKSILPFVAKKGIIYGKIKGTIEQLKK